MEVEIEVYLRESMSASGLVVNSKAAAQIALDGEVGAECLRAEVMQGPKAKEWSARERYSVFASNFWRIEEKKLVDDAGSQGSTVECRSCFKQNTKNFAAAQLGKNGLHIDAIVLRSYFGDFDARVL